MARMTAMELKGIKVGDIVAFRHGKVTESGQVLQILDAATRFIVRSHYVGDVDVYYRDLLAPR